MYFKNMLSSTHAFIVLPTQYVWRVGLVLIVVVNGDDDKEGDCNLQEPKNSYL